MHSQIYSMIELASAVVMPPGALQLDPILAAHDGTLFEARRRSGRSQIRSYRICSGLSAQPYSTLWRSYSACSSDRNLVPEEKDTHRAEGVGGEGGGKGVGACGWVRA